MASFPILTSLEVRNYGLFPGSQGKGLLTISFTPGLTLVLGANGLGKTTLITMLFRLLTGPFDLNLPSGSIGTSELRAAALSKHSRMAFGARVNDAASHATASLLFELGRRRFLVTRSLSDLTLKSFSLDGVEQSTDEEILQKEIVASANVATFGEWILILRTLVFFFEDRRALVWDASAQRQLLRCLLLPPEQASRWAKAEREILEFDTRMRNLQAALRREQRDTQETDRRTQSAPNVRNALREAESAAELLREQQELLTDSLESLDQSRHRHRLDAFRARAEHDAAIQELERARLTAIEARFPSADASMRYILARIMTDDECLVCRTPGRANKRKALITAIDQRRCVMCDAPLNAAAEPIIDLDDQRIDGLRRKVLTTLTAMEASTKMLDDASRDYEEASKKLSQFAADLADRRKQINVLVNQLPPEEQVARRQHDELRALEQRVESLRANIKEKRDIFTADMIGHREAIRRFATGIKHAFEAAARGFLFEDSELSWSPVRTQVGQAGAEGTEPIEYPAFAVDLSGGDFANVVRREGPDQVSESQREFIDLAFRMALIHVAANNQAGTIVIDAPESSLDAVFIDRAANVLAGFANANGLNRLLATSNLAGSELIPALLIAAEKDAASRPGRIVDLFKEGVPTRAMRELAHGYDKYREKLYETISNS